MAMVGKHNDAAAAGGLPRASSDGNIVAKVRRRSMQGESGGLEVEQVKCECCGMSEECTPGYIARVKEVFCGHWVCGLCAEAVKEEHHRMGKGSPMADAVRAHMCECRHFNTLDRHKPAICLAAGLTQLLRKNLEGHVTGGGTHSKPNSPKGRLDRRIPSHLTRSTSCIPSKINHLS